MRIAAAQMDLRIQANETNVDSMLERMRAAHGQAAELIIFPECAVTGYCFESLDEARGSAESVPGPATERMVEGCRETGLHVIFGTLELVGEEVFNVAVLAGPAGVQAVYRKVHLPYLGVDRFTTYGDQPFAVHAVSEAQIGMNICYDASFPEGSRSMALMGADLIALPTNWPPGADLVAQYVINTRAMENGVYFAAVNRVGEERGFTFIGQSRICDPLGQTIAAAEGREETILYADIDVEIARQKRIVRVPRQHVIDRFADRRPEFYDQLIRPHSLPRPGRESDLD